MFCLKQIFKRAGVFLVHDWKLFVYRLSILSPKLDFLVKGTTLKLSGWGNGLIKLSSNHSFSYPRLLELGTQVERHVSTTRNFR